MIKLFISYRSLDSAKVDMLVARMHSLKYLVGTWQDKTGINDGEDWWTAIVEAIIECDVFIFMVSHESVKNSNCRAELSYARKRNRFILPMVLEGEFIFNPITGKNDINYWQDIPDELNEIRAQFLFYEGTSFVKRIENALDLFQRERRRWRDMDAPIPLDPRHASEASNNSTALYADACDYARRLQIDIAERLFQKLVNMDDPDFAEEANEWISILRDYQKLLNFDKHDSTRYKIESNWLAYKKKFPKPFEKLFDPKGFASHYDNVLPTEVKVESKPLNPLKLSIKAPTLRDGSPVSKSTSSKQEVSTIYTEETKSNPRSQLRDRIVFARTFSGQRNSDWQSFTKVFTVKGIKIEMCLVPVGNFKMGSNKDGSEKRIHNQIISEPYWISVHPITNAQWRKVVNDSMGTVKPPEWTDLYNNTYLAKHPVVGITYRQCINFVKWLGNDWDLPTEAQWEFAARGLDNLLYPFGKKFRADLAVYGANSGQITAAVGDRPGSASWVGAQDMIGNVWEWVANRDIDYPDKYQGKQQEIDTIRAYVVRGGSWKSNEDSLHAFVRNTQFSIIRSYDIGFRPIRKISE